MSGHARRQYAVICATRRPCCRMEPPRDAGTGTESLHL